MEKVYVAVGNDVQEGSSTIEWTLRNWSSQSISLVILHLDTTSRDLVDTPFGKLPPSAVSDEKLEDIRQREQDKVDKLLSRYLASCGKAGAEVLKIERSDEPTCGLIVGLITRHRISKLVIGITLLKSSSGKTRSSIGGSFYVYKHKPDYCELFMLCGGKQVFLREQNEEGYLEDNQGVKLKEKSGFKGWLGKKITDTVEREPDQRLGLGIFQNRQKNYTDVVADYLILLSKFNPDDEHYEEECSVAELLNLDHGTATTCNGRKTEIIKAKINDEAQKIIQEKTKKTKANIDRQKGAERVISLCNERANELQSGIDKEIDSQVELKNDLDASRRQIDEMAGDVEDNKNRLNSVREHMSELQRKLISDISAKQLAELELDKAVAVREEILIEIEKLREQKDVLRRGVEFCSERISNATCKYREFTKNEIRDATSNFSDCVKLKSGTGFSRVCKGRLNGSAVAIKLQTSYNHQELHDKVEILCDIRHPNVVSTIGACFDPKCIVFEYLPNGSLEEIFSSQRLKRNRAPSWYTRIQIASQICAGLGFLHSAEPWPIVHRDLKPYNILLDRNLVPKINNIRLTPYSHEQQLRSDVRDFGYIMLFLLTGRGESDVIADMAIAVQTADISEVLHSMARDWPLALAEEFACLAMRCIAMENPDLSIMTVTRDVENLLKKATRIREMPASGSDEEKESPDIPNGFICPINQDVMKNPHVAADGFSYELEAIEGWLRTGSTKSPMTNLNLNHTNLTPNHTLRFLINDWRKT